MFFPSLKVISSPPIDQKVLTLYNRYRKPCERGGIGRRTGFRILRLVHGGSSPFARTKKALWISQCFFIVSHIFAKADLSEIYSLPIVSTLEDLRHSFRIRLTRVLRGAGIENGILSDGILLGKVQLLRHPIVFERQRDVHLLI